MKLPLDSEESQVVELLRHRGAMTPSEIAVHTLMLPRATLGALSRLEKSGYVVLRDLPSSPDGRFAVLSNNARKALEG